MSTLKPGESIAKSEEAREDEIGRGTLYLTNQRLFFVKTGGILFFSGRPEVKAEYPLDQIGELGVEGTVIKKLVVGSRGYRHRFHVKDPDGWAATIRNAISNYIRITPTPPPTVQPSVPPSLEIPKPVIKPPPAPTTWNFCPYCGAKLPANARFCPRCGTQLRESD
ncbi:zinc ribbon domain-containing protein [Candidatus Bathyarchaeota archaeon]|nr:zinc ribbon domain-containing protein [Candidatus Bathyarchaeota archaeon]